MKKEEILLVDIALFFQFFLFNNASWIPIMKPYGSQKHECIYSIYIDFMQLSSSNYWSKMNLGFQNVVTHILKLVVYK
jgi:hypothetical protein